VCTHIYIHIYFSFLTSLSSVPKPCAHLIAMNTNLNFK
jgi:hypothetical protein